MKQKFSLSLFFTRLLRYFQKLDRIAIVWYFIVIAAIIMLSVSFSFTVFQHDYFKQKADAQQKKTIKNPISRGTIKSSEKSLAGIIGVSMNLGTIAVDPSQEGSKEKLLDFLGDVIIEEFCSQNTNAECIENISNYTRGGIENQNGLTKNILKKNVIGYLKNKMETPIESVLLKADLNDVQVEKINSWNENSLFFVVNNLYVNPTKVKNKDDLAKKL